jgi:putative heme-binding domain-containing protein
VFGYFPKPDGAGFKLERFDFTTSNKEKKFAGSDFIGGSRSANNELPTQFRPSDVCVGPDGAIYIADWFDARVGGHSDLDPTTSGTIYRIAPKGFQPRVPKIDLATIAGQIEALKSPAVNVRHSGFTRLRAQGSKAVPAVAALLKDENPFIAARAVWLLAQMGPEGRAKVAPLAAGKDDTMRLVAYRALRRAGQEPLALAAQMTADSSPAIRREAALMLRDVPAGQSRDLLVKIARPFDGRDRAYLEAFGLGCEGKEREVYQALAAAQAGPPTQWPDSFARIAWRLSAPEAVAGFKARALAPSLDQTQRKLMVDALAFVKTPEAARAMVELAATPDFPLREQATWWLNSRQHNDWREFGVVALMKEQGLIKEQPLVSAISPEPPAGPSKLPPVKEIVALIGDAQRGATSAVVCATCHKLGKQGVDFGPELTQFGKTQPREVILNAMVNPSADISHGYDGTRVETTDGLTIDGIVTDNGDPLVIKCIGGQVQSVPRSRIKKVGPLGRSLMLSADALGLTPQTLADIAAYLQSNAIQ